jgi:hypothetical protein
MVRGKSVLLRSKRRHYAAPQDEFKNRRKTRSRRGNEAEVFFAPKSAALSAATILEHRLRRSIHLRESSCIHAAFD